MFIFDLLVPSHFYGINVILQRNTCLINANIIFKSINSW